jgi:sirohydrochlorin cobaltochelatase
MAKQVATLVIAHGSRHITSNEEFLNMVAQLQTRHPQKKFFGAFLEIATPDIPTGIDQVISSGYKNVKIFPFFIA